MKVSKVVKSFTAGLLSALLLGSPLCPTQQADAAMAKGSKFVGNIIASSVPSNYSTYWNQVTPENASKWGSVEASRGTMNWSNVDLTYNYCKTNGFPFKHHTLVWGSQEPGWISGLSASDQKAEVTEWIQASGKRYPNADFVDVVNEPLHTKPDFRNAIGGDGSTGWDWIVWSFQQARQAFPNSKLLINEYGIISDPNAASNYVKIINILKNQGLVDGIGIQCHYFNMDTVSVSTMNNVLNMLSATGLPIYVSELDITGDDNTQLARYKEKFPVLYENSSVKGITLWGWIQGQTWADNTYLVTSSGTERPALQWLKQYLAGFTPTSPSPVPSVTPTVTPISKIYGDVNGDGSVDALDFTTLKMYLLGTIKSLPADNGDVNLDGTVDANDYAILKKYLLGMIPSLPVGSINPTPTPTSPAPTPSPIPTVTPTATPSPVATPSIKPNKIVALTFDDGPDTQLTPLVLNKLDKYKVPATFMMIGQKINDSTAPIIKRIINSGFEIGNHSWAWASMNSMSKTDIQKSVNDTTAAILKYSGTTPKFFRAPNLATSSTMLDAIDLTFVQGVVAYDWDQSTSAQTRANYIINGAKDGAIFLMHDVQPLPHPTPEALDIIIPTLQSQGYEFVTLSELFRRKGVTLSSTDNKIYTYLP